MARIRASGWGSEEYWITRITGYMNRELHPQKALMPRVVYVASENDSAIGFVAGHLTHRYECDGELEWINVIHERRGDGLASELLRLLAAWFGDQNAARICVDVDPENSIARQFYARHGAERLNEHWMVWNDIRTVLHEELRSK
ncbi:MAG TPA: GNAT family N-acetyltransferase [Candidatus Acidoferrum sp.]|nr:GNAT family N-acetyltransferase [Candidatus Acidoferrum sp.]